MSFNKKNAQIAKAGFQYKCLFILTEAYRVMKENGNYSVSWEEENLTAQLIYYTENCLYCIKWKIHVIQERRIYTEEIIFGEKSSKRASRIDMQMLSWQNENKDVFHIEAKNLCENDWVKKGGTTVSSSYQLNRYVNTGVKHFFSNHYPSNSCLCGYILQGDTEDVIEKINAILKKKSLNELQVSTPINKHNQIYTIKHDNFELFNIFLDFKR
jgi:hypothetical protein